MEGRRKQKGSRLQAQGTEREQFWMAGRVTYFFNPAVKFVTTVTDG